MALTQAVDRWFLENVETDGDVTGRVPIRDMPFRIGRRPGLSLVLSSKSVSLVHAELWHDDDRLCLRDLSSTNGTYVNGRRLGHRDAVLSAGDLIHLANVEFRVGRRSAGESLVTIDEPTCHWITVLAHFDQLFERGGAVPFFQPIVKLPGAERVGYEVLARSSLEGLKTPLEMFKVAARLGMEAELSRLMRRIGVTVGQQLAEPANLFLNTHPAELLGAELLDSLRQLRDEMPARSLTLEIHEAAVTNLAQMRQLRQVLGELDIQLAYDDFGAGQARLVDLVEVPPDYLKFDMRLVRDIHTASAQRRQMLRALVRMAHDLGIAAIAEGVERAEEAEVCQEVGFELAQGYYFGRPAAVSQWSHSL